MAMIATEYDLEDYIYRLLAASEVKTTIGGSVYHERLRPADSKAEDVCVNVMSFNATARPYTAYVNINAYVPYINVSNGGAKQQVPDRVRLKAIAAAIDTFIRGASTQDVPIAVERTSELEYDGVSQTCYNTLIYCILND